MPCPKLSVLLPIFNIMQKILLIQHKNYTFLFQKSP